MSIARRSLANESDKYQMAALARQTAAEDLHVTDLPYRFSSWAFDEPDNVSLWFHDNGELIGWAVMQAPFWEIDYVCCQDSEPDLHAEMLAWADGRARLTRNTAYGRPCWFVNVFSQQVHRIHDLERAGFQNQSGIGADSLSKVLMRRSIPTAVRVYAPPSGYTVRPLAAEEELEAYVLLHRSVFGSKNMTAEWRGRTLRHPDYKPELDLVVQSPDGRLGAFCICWLDPESGDGRVEPLGCHKDFRHLALGRVALSHALHRLQSLGAQHIFVETDSYRDTAFRLYESFGFEVVQDVLVYRKDYPE